MVIDYFYKSNRKVLKLWCLFLFINFEPTPKIPITLQSTIFSLNPQREKVDNQHSKYWYLYSLVSIYLF